MIKINYCEKNEVIYLNKYMITCLSKDFNTNSRELIFVVELKKGDSILSVDTFYMKETSLMFDVLLKYIKEKNFLLDTETINYFNEFYTKLLEIINNYHYLIKNDFIIDFELYFKDNNLLVLNKKYKDKSLINTFFYVDEKLFDIIIVFKDNRIIPLEDYFDILPEVNENGFEFMDNSLKGQKASYLANKLKLVANKVEPINLYLIS